MKKVVFILVALMAFAGISAQNYSHPFSSVYGWSFHTPGKSVVDSELGFIHIECDSTGNYWFKHEIITIENVREMVDQQGNRVFGRNSIRKGGRIWLKLDNDEIITLVCNYYSEVHSGYYTSSTDIYNQYDIYSYFSLTNDVIEKLKTHKIIKMRSELVRGVMDMDLSERSYKNSVPKQISLQKPFEKLDSETMSKINEIRQQHMMNSDPLVGF